MVVLEAATSIPRGDTGFTSWGDYRLPIQCVLVGLDLMLVGCILSGEQKAKNVIGFRHFVVN